MRDLATATGLNVASLYHYFPSKQDLLVAVLAERGFLDELAITTPTPGDRTPRIELADLLNEILQSMLEVEDFIRLMLGEVMRNDETALSVGHELIAGTQDSLEQWIANDQPELGRRPRRRRGGPDVAGHADRLVLRARGGRPRRRRPERGPANAGRRGRGHLASERLTGGRAGQDPMRGMRRLP